MAFTLKVKLPLMTEFILVEGIDSMFLNMYVAVMVILPKSYETGLRTADLRPIFVVEVLTVLLLVAHLY